MVGLTQTTNTHIPPLSTENLSYPPIFPTLIAHIIKEAGDIFEIDYLSTLWRAFLLLSMGASFVKAT